MKKIYKISILIICGFLLIGCPPDDEITTYETIKSVRARLFSFDKNGIYPYFEEFNPEQLGIIVSPDSIITRTELATSFSFGNYAYAKGNTDISSYPNNAIDSLNVFTIYDFDENHPAGSNINDILLYLDGMGQTSELNINDLISFSHSLKFSTIPANDSLKFKVTGRITEEGIFNTETELVVLQ